MKRKKKVKYNNTEKFDFMKTNKDNIKNVIRDKDNLTHRFT